MDEKIFRIKSMLADEQATIARCRREVTADYPSVLAEHREQCLRDVLKILTGEADGNH